MSMLAAACVETDASTYSLKNRLGSVRLNRVFMNINYWYAHCMMLPPSMVIVGMVHSSSTLLVFLCTWHVTYLTKE